MTGTLEEHPDFVWTPPPAPAVPPPDVHPPAPGLAPILLTRPVAPPPLSAPRRPPGTALVAVLLLVVVALVAAVVVALVFRGTARPDSAPAMPGWPAFPSYSPTDCGVVDTSVRDYYTLGHDRFPSIIVPGSPELVSTCRHETATSIAVSYASDPTQWTWLIANFALALQQYGLTPGPLTNSGGYLWGRSVDAGQWLLVSYAADDTTGLTVQLTKGPRSIIPFGLAETTSGQLDTVVDPIAAGGKLTLVPAKGWDQHLMMWSYQGTGWQSNGLVYNRISGSTFEGTLAVWGETYDAGTDRLPLADAANSSMTGMMWDRFPADSLVAPDSVTVGGRPALSYTMTMYDTLMRYVFVDGPTTMYILAAQVDAAKPALMDEVQQMIDSSVIS